MTDPRVEAACAAYKGVAGRVSRQAMARALEAAAEVALQVPAETPGRLASARALRSETLHYRLNHSGEWQTCSLGSCPVGRKALADYRAAPLVPEPERDACDLLADRLAEALADVVATRVWDDNGECLWCGVGEPEHDEDCGWLRGRAVLADYRAAKGER